MREKDLQAAIGIAKLLLDNTITLKSTNEDLQREIENSENRYRMTKQEMTYLKERLMITEEQFDNTSSNLRTAEEQILMITQERDQFRSENEKLLKKNAESVTELEKYSQSLKSEKEKIHKELENNKEEKLKLYKEGILLRKDLREMKEQIDNLLEHNGNLEEKIKIYQEDLERIEKTNEELHKILHIKATEPCEDDISRHSNSINYVNELEQLEIYQDTLDTKYSTEESINCIKFCAKQPGNLKSSYILPSKFLNNSTRSLHTSHLAHSRRFLESVDKASKTLRIDDSQLDTSPYDSDRFSELRKSTNLSIRKTINELERQLINRKSITPNKSLLDNNERRVLNINTSFIDTDGAEDPYADNFESPKSVFADFKDFESFRKDSDDCSKSGFEFKSPMFGYNKKFVFSEYRVVKQDSVCIDAHTAGLGSGSGRNLEEEYFLMVMY